MAVRFAFFLICINFINCAVLDLSCNDIRQLVDGHNKRRLLVAKGLVAGQPAASRMTAMIWDEELAEKAAKWASRNKFSHNPNRTIPSKRFKTGENVFVVSTTDPDYKFNLDEALDSWFEEHKLYRFRPMSRAEYGSGRATGHYTQMIWATSVHIGCAVSKYKEGRWHKFLVVCNYGPAGNVLTKTPYEKGIPSNKLVCGAGNCSRPYGSKCVTNLRIKRTLSVNKYYN